MTKSKEQPPKLVVDYSQDELDAATREVIANDLVKRGQDATEENVELISRTARETYVTIEGKGGRSLMTYWDFSRHRAVKKLLLKKNVETG